jgi:hypothetical protein
MIGSTLQEPNTDPITVSDVVSAARESAANCFWIPLAARTEAAAAVALDAAFVAELAALVALEAAAVAELAAAVALVAAFVSDVAAFVAEVAADVALELAAVVGAGMGRGPVPYLTAASLDVIPLIGPGTTSPAPKLSVTSVSDPSVQTISPADAACIQSAHAPSVVTISIGSTMAPSETL